MKNLFLLKTEKHIKNVGDLVKDKYGDIHIFTKKDSKEYGKTIAKLNIYITSDEEIKDGNYVLELKDSSVWAIQIQPNTDLSKYKKIILTTDQDLNKDGVQAIDDEFLEWFVKNPSCEWVEVKSWIKTYEDGSTFDRMDYEIIIPKEEPKQETLEEVAKNATKMYVNEREKQTVYLSFIEGAKWQQEQICTSEFIQRIRATKSDAEARRIIREQLKNK